MQPSRSFTTLKSGTKVWTTKGSIGLERKYNGEIMLWKHYGYEIWAEFGVDTKQLKDLRDVIGEFIENVEFVEKNGKE